MLQGIKVFFVNTFARNWTSFIKLGLLLCGG